MSNGMNKQWISTASVITLAKLSSVLKISFVFGSFFTWFSASSIAIPLIGLLGGAQSAIAFFMINLLGRVAFGYGLSLKILAFYIPGLCASLYLARRSAFFGISISLMCIAAFVAHPVGGQAYIYSAYWLIPMILCFWTRKSLFTESLIATFIAHAVGSTIWIYTCPSTAAFWIALIPIVALERCIYATGITLVHNALMLIEAKKQALKIKCLPST